jgi:hypothetical protein
MLVVGVPRLADGWVGAGSVRSYPSRSPYQIARNLAIVNPFVGAGGLGGAI